MPPKKRRKTNESSPSARTGSAAPHTPPRGSLDRFLVATPPSRDKRLPSEQELDDYRLALKLQREEDEEQKKQQQQLHEEHHTAERFQVETEARQINGCQARQDDASPRPQAEVQVSQVAGSQRDRENSKELQAPHASSLFAPVQKGLDFSRVPLNEAQGKFQPEHYEHVLKGQFISGRAPYALLVHCFTLINTTKSRISIVDTLCNFLRLLILFDPDSLLCAVWLTTNAIAPEYEGAGELGLGPSIFHKALKSVSGISSTALRTLWHRHGDPGDVAFSAQVSVRTLGSVKALSIAQVYDTLTKIALVKGAGGQEKKQRMVERLLLACKGEEIRYMARTLLQHLRIGAVKTTMLIALSRAFTMTKPSGANWELAAVDWTNKNTAGPIFKQNEAIVKYCFARRPNYNDLVQALLTNDIESLPAMFQVKVGVPIKPMLGIITRDISDMLGRMGHRDFTCEYKYDGQRAQIHCDAEGRVRIFSRHLEDMTGKYPDLIELVPTLRADNISSFILEGEVVAVDNSDGSLKTFQTLANRGRKDVEISSVKGLGTKSTTHFKQLLERPFRERRDLLRSLFPLIPNRFAFVASTDTNDQDEIEQFFKLAVAAKCEGLMVKTLDNPPDVADDTEQKSRRKPLLASYEPDLRAEGWLKVKKDYDKGSDSLDLVPIGAWHGMGRKASWYSPILLALRDEETGALQAVCKCISGFTDTFYKELNDRYAPDSENCSTTPLASFVESTLVPDVWFEPREVWEIRGADVTLSPVYRAAIGHISEERGLSLRFPRFMRVRDDKSIEEATTARELANMYRNQQEHHQEQLPELDE